MERGKLPLTRARLDGLVRHLRVPEAWFTSDDADSLVQPPADSLSRIEEELMAFRAETAARDAEAMQLLDDRLPPIAGIPQQRPA